MQFPRIEPPRANCFQNKTPEHSRELLPYPLRATKPTTNSQTSAGNPTTVNTQPRSKTKPLLHAWPSFVSPAISHHAGRGSFKSPQANNSPIKHDCRRPSVSWPRYTNETDAQYTKRTGLDTLSAKLRGLIMNAIHANDQEPSQRSTNTRTSADSTSEAHAKKRGPSHGTEDPTIAANVSKRLAAAEMPPLATRTI